MEVETEIHTFDTVVTTMGVAITRTLSAFVLFVLLGSQAPADDQLFTEVVANARFTTSGVQTPDFLKVSFDYDWFLAEDYFETIPQVWTIPVSMADIGTTIVANRYSLPYTFHGINRALSQDFCCGQYFSIELHSGSQSGMAGIGQLQLWADYASPQISVDASFVPFMDKL